MRRIRREQTSEFRKQAFNSFDKRALVHLRRDMSELTELFSDEKLILRVHECIPRAKAYGLIAEAQIIMFVDVTFLLGKDFDENPDYDWSLEILRSTKLEPSDRASLLLATAVSVYREKRGG